MEPIEMPRGGSRAGNKPGGSSDNPAPKANLSEHLANERTYLAYLRTSISLISFGITVNRFSLFLIQSDRIPRETHMRFDLTGVSRVGFGMVIFGLALMIWAGFHFTNVSHGIDRGNYRPNQWAAWIITLGVLLGGGITLIWLFPH